MMHKVLKDNSGDLYSIGDSIVGGYFVIQDPYVSYSDYGMSDEAKIRLMCSSFKNGIYIIDGDAAILGRCILLEVNCNLSLKPFSKKR